MTESGGTESGDSESISKFRGEPLATTFDINLPLANAPLLQTQEPAIHFAHGPPRPSGAPRFAKDWSGR